jgi:diguanylate cyclase (GGDEF)-like protein
MRRNRAARHIVTVRTRPAVRLTEFVELMPKVGRRDTDGDPTVIRTACAWFVRTLGRTRVVGDLGGALRRVPLWLAFVVAGLAATVLYAMDVAATVAFAAVGLGSVGAIFAGPVRYRVQPVRPWRLLAWAAVLFLIGALLRPLLVDATGPMILLADAFTVAGYLMMIASLATFLNARSGVERHALIDGLIVCIGAAVASTLLFALPAASIQGRPIVVSVIAGLFPLLDAILLLLVVNLAFTTAVRRPSFVLLLGMMALIFVGDLAYSIIGTEGTLYGSRLIDLPFLLAYTLGGAAALHPSAGELARATPRSVQSWSMARLLVFLPAVALPFALTVALPGRSRIDNAVLGIGGAAIVVLLMTRAVSAVQSHAAAQRRYEHQATHDPLTGLPNRRMLTATVDRLLASPASADGAQVWMFFLDLDGFKFVNDSWGHTVGDRLIVDVGRRLRERLPDEATVARVGGDEFVIVRRCTAQEAAAQAQAIMGCLEEPLRVAAAEVVIGASMGISSAGLAPDDSVSAESLMRDADTAMYRTKAEGRGRWTVFDASMRQAVRDRIEIESALRAAVADEQLTVAYQPIVHVGTGRPIGAEALVRWVHPTRGPIGPDVFIRIAEESNLISALGGFVLRRSIRQMATWRALGAITDDFWMSVNVSPRQLNDPDFPATLADELRANRLPTSCLVLEITESVMVEGGEVTEQVLVELRAMGVRISVDDFGTGFSALGYLRRHPVTGVKIDRSFVNGLGANAEDEEIVRAVVAMSAALKLSVVAEGVETAEQRAVLAGMGVTQAQGWLWGKAVDPQLFAETWSPDIPPALGVPAQAVGNA